MFSPVIWIVGTFFICCRAVHLEEWQPVLHDGYDATNPQSSLVRLPYQQAAYEHQDQCGLDKVAFIQDLYFQYIQYKVHLPELKEFTLCYWSKFNNHSNDHPVFSYAVDGQPRAVLSWISNTERSSYFSLSVEGHTMYRLNYPLRLNKWYHTCQSWNGKTGEWQIWVNAERVGRGFHNRLVGHSIPSGGLAISGQEQTQLGGGFSEGKYAPKGAGGMLGEITMVQLYNVALTAGKAHRDHKHHHAHQYDHNGNQITTPRPTTPLPRTPLPTHPLLTGGQINPRARLNIAGGQPQNQQPQLVQGQNFNAQLLNGQFVGNLASQQLIRANQQQFPIQQQPQQLQILTQNAQPLINSGLVHSSLTNPANVQFIDDTGSIETHQLFKRDNEAKFGDKLPEKVNNNKKRELYLSAGALIDTEDSSASVEGGFIDGLAGISENEPILEKQKESYEREPAEAEVKAVMNICTGCDEEPFGKALIFGWRSVPKKLYSGAIYAPAVPQCKVF